MKNSKALVLLSGGQDSTTCLAQALSDFPAAVEAIAFDYGQRHKIELIQAKEIADMAGIRLKILDISLISELSSNSLTDPSMKIETIPGELPNTFVPGRNLLFLSFAAIYARQKGIQTLYIGVCETDYSGYPDCRDDFIQSLNRTLNLSMEYEFEIVTPLMHLTKAETILLMQKLGKFDWYRLNFHTRIR